MVQVFPFTGLRYTLETVGSYQHVTAPPYDVISPEAQATLLGQSPHNVVNLILGQKHDSDTVEDSVYTRAANTLKLWMSEHVLEVEDEPAYYAYTQSWQGITRKGFIGRLYLEPYETQQVLPHEFTLGGPKADRLALTTATETNLSPIFCLYHDPEKQIEAMLENAPPEAITVVDADAVTHVFWPIRDPQGLKTIQTLLATKTALIADGHHRYETALAYQQQQYEKKSLVQHAAVKEPWDFTMAFFTNMADEGLRIYPTHRILESYPEGWTAERLLSEMAIQFEPVERDPLFWVQHGSQNSKQGYQLKSSVSNTDIPEVLRSLDVANLDHFIFEGLLQQTANALKQAGHLHFVRDEDEVKTALEKGALVFWVHAPSVETTQHVCESGYRMPQKSTYFYPKLLSGLVFYHHPAHPRLHEECLTSKEGQTV
jgi:uncharacterized protein (DUF1015 family)